MLSPFLNYFIFLVRINITKTTKITANKKHKNIILKVSLLKSKNTIIMKASRYLTLLKKDFIF